jgi:regulatory protein
MNTQQKKLLGYTYDLLARRRYTIREMIKKLDAANQKSPEPLTETELQEILESLVQSNFLNDREYAEFHIDAQIRKKPVGKLKIKQQLQLKGISQELIDRALNTANLNETELAKIALEKKLRLLKTSFPLDVKTKQKVFRYLQSLGFNSEAVFKALNQYGLEIEEC